MRRTKMNKRGRPQKLHKLKKTSACVPQEILSVLQMAHQSSSMKGSFSEWWEHEMMDYNFENIQMKMPKQTDNWVHPSFFLSDLFWMKVEKHLEAGYSKRSIILSACYALYEKHKK